MRLTGKEAIEKLQEKLSYDTETGMFIIDANDIVVGDLAKMPHSDEGHGGSAGGYVLVNEGGLQGQIALHNHS